MTDERIIEAVRRVVERCRKANPSHMVIPVSGGTAMEWLLEELTAAPGQQFEAKITEVASTNRFLSDVSLQALTLGTHAVMERLADLEGYLKLIISAYESGRHEDLFCLQVARDALKETTP